MKPVGAAIPASALASCGASPREVKKSGRTFPSSGGGLSNILKENEGKLTTANCLEVKT